AAIAEAHFHRGNAARDAGDHAAAIAAYEASLAAAPGNPAVENNLGLARAAQGDADGAEACYRRALALDPMHADALANLANVLFARGEFAATEAVYERLFALLPTLPAYVWLQRGLGLQRQSRFVDAEACFRAALLQEPAEPRILMPLAHALLEQARHRDALPVLTELVAREPDHAWGRAMLCMAKQQLSDWNGIEAAFAALGELLDRGPDGVRHPPNPFAVLAMPFGPAQQLTVAQSWSRSLRVPDVTLPPCAFPADGKLRIGFVSSDLRAHALTFLALEFWERLRGGRLETFAYSLDPDAPGALGERIRAAFDHYVNVADDSAAAIAARLRRDGIGVAIDCNGYTRSARTEIFLLRPAPVQINYLGFPGTLGTPCFDYIVADAFGLPPDAERWYAEKPLRMPHSSFPCDTHRAPPGPPPPRSAHGLPDDAFVFCCFNNNNKILPRVFAVWMRLLAAVDRSVLWLFTYGPEVEANLSREAAAAGIAPQRLVFARRAPLAEHLARQPLADLFLDTLPYGAHTTTNDALLMGLPVLTCAGDRLASRIAGSQLHAIGLPELVTASLDEYEALALALARDPARLRALRARLAANRATHPLFDMRRYAADFEDLVQGAWAGYRATAR
ncbi:MAG: tetratricopeptide repeat protein, partial [Betaproteobacteria bacterium]